MISHSSTLSKAKIWTKSIRPHIKYRGIYGNEICAPSSVLILQNGNHLGELINLERFSEFSLHLIIKKLRLIKKTKWN